MTSTAATGRRAHQGSIGVLSASLLILGLTALGLLALCSCGGSSTSAVSQAVHRSPAPAANLSWTRTPLDPGPLEDHWDGLGVLRDGRVWVAWGEWWNWSGEASSSLRDAKLGPSAVWTSADGLHWTRSLRLPMAKSALISKVVRWKGGLVAVGTEGSRPTNLGNVAFGHPVTWTSRGGVVWRRSPDQESLRYSGADRRNHAADAGEVAAGGRYLIMTGSDWWDAASYSVPRVWASSDGLTWKRAAIASEAKSSYPDTIVTGGPVLLALGECWDDPAGSMRHTIWTSADGRVWRAADTSAMSHAAVTTDIEVVAGGPGFVAYGRDSRSAKTPTGWGKGVGPVAIWTSADGRTWSQIADPGFGPAAEIVGMAAGGPGLIAYGQEGGLIGGEQSPFWKSSWGYGPHWGHAAVWTSSDGRRWQKVTHFAPLDNGNTATSEPDPERAGDTVVFSLLSIRGGWVALGARTVSRTEMESAGMTPSVESGRLLLWTSRDAQQWTPYIGDQLVDGYALSPPVVSQGRVLVVGRDERLSKACAWSVSLPAIR
jgi:hypothetical protein